MPPRKDFPERLHFMPGSCRFYPPGMASISVIDDETYLNLHLVIASGLSANH
ncbi:MAG: hypothetical protein R6U64_07570 [Bacteroidales bacterium]